MDYNERIARLQLARTQRVGPLAFQLLIKKYGSAINAVKYLGKNNQKFSLFDHKLAETEWRETEEFGGQILVFGDNNYPKILRNIPAPPPVLSVIGNRHLLDKPAIAVVGARDSSLNGQKLANRFAEVLAQKGYVIISGMARGIDTAAHLGATKHLESAGTIAVLAGGIDDIYPKENEDLYHKIKDLGLIVSEAPLQTKPIAKHFPKRNRIISGLCLGLLVIEAAIQSGTLITAHYAIEQGREVFAIPGSPLDTRMRGCNDLIRNGAHLCETPDDIIPIIQGYMQPDLSDNYNTDEWQNPFPDEIPAGELIYAKQFLNQKLTHAPVHIDELLRESANQGVMPAIFHLALLEMELFGQIEHLPGNKYATIIGANADGALNGLF